MSKDVVIFITSVDNKQRLGMSGISVDHITHGFILIFLASRLNHSIHVCLGQQIIQGIQMKNLNGGSIYDVRDMLTLDW